jgi:hypothetical protein
VGSLSVEYRLRTRGASRNARCPKIVGTKGFAVS